MLIFIDRSNFGCRHQFFFFPVHAAPRKGMPSSPKSTAISPKSLPYSHPKTPTPDLPLRLEKIPKNLPKQTLSCLLSRNPLTKNILKTLHQLWTNIKKERKGLILGGGTFLREKNYKKFIEKNSQEAFFWKQKRPFCESFAQSSSTEKNSSPPTFYSSPVSNVKKKLRIKVTNFQAQLDFFYKVTSLCVSLSTLLLGGLRGPSLRDRW